MCAQDSQSLALGLALSAAPQLAVSTRKLLSAARPLAGIFVLGVSDTFAQLSDLIKPDISNPIQAPVFVIKVPPLGLVNSKAF